MRIETMFLRSRVARRIFIMFVCCALLPLTALAILSFIQVTTQLHEQSQKRLHQASKAVGMGIFERLLLLENEMKLMASKVATRYGSLSYAASKAFGKQITERFEGLIVITEKGERIPLFGRLQEIHGLTREQSEHIRSGGTLVMSKSHSNLSSSVFMSMELDPGQPNQGVLMGEIDPTYLWGTSEDNALTPMFEFCVLDHSNNILFSSLPATATFPQKVTAQMISTAVGQFEWAPGGKEYLAGYWSIFLQGRFLSPKWTVVLSESKVDALAPMAHFKKIFPLVILISLWVVLLLSVIQIRKSLIPLEKLQEGTKRIAQRDFGTRVTVSSRDEFEELAASFNTMASRLGKQFNILTTLAEIDRAILSSLDTERIVDVVLTRMPDVFPCDGVSVTLIDLNAEMGTLSYTRSDKTDRDKRVEMIILTAEEIQELSRNPESLLVETDGASPSYVAPLVNHGLTSFLLLPIMLKQRLSGLITLGYLESPEFSPEDLRQARQFADQMGVALSNARLIEELSQLNWGTLTALARAIDAKSSWTAGHSERVTKLAMKMGKILELSQEEMEALHRGGLLHDIGKLGVPAQILDKPGMLSKEEERLMREHVRLGARILKPIVSYAEIIPIVLQHHEWFDGKGYLDGLAGKKISLGARIYAVADSYDAITTLRPYRQALDRKVAIEMIKQGSGSRYDPEIVEIFLEVMAQEAEEGVRDK